MINYLIALIIILCFNFTAIAQPDFYYLQVRSENANVQCFLNGFPVYELENESPMSNTVPVQMYMVGKGNQLTIKMNAINEQTPKVSSKILPYQKGDMVDSYSDKEGIISLDLEGKNTKDKSVVFDNERFDFSEVFVNSKVLNKGEVLDYGDRLYTIARKGKIDKFMAEMTPKITDIAKSLNYPEKKLRNNLQSGLETTFFNTKLPSIKDGDLSADSYCDGRVWELRIKGKPFFYLEDEEGHTSLQIYVSEVGGTLGIVR